MTPELLLEQFDALTDAPCGVQSVRELILQLALRGKLVPQDPSDEPASVLLEEIFAEREQLVRAGKLPKANALTPISPEETPFIIPEGWAWVRIGAAMNLVNGRAFKPSDWSSSGVPIVRIQNLNNLSAPFNHCAFEVADKFYVNDEDLLLSWSGTPGTSFGAFVWRRGRAVLNQHIFRCELLAGAFVNDFARLAINGRLDEMIAQAHGGVGLQHITKGRLDRLPIVLPPLAEQRRIVAKVDELMTMCDQLENRQRRRAELRMRTNRSLLHQLVAVSDQAMVGTQWRRVERNFAQLYDSADTLPDLRRAVSRLAMYGMLVPQDPGDEPAAALLERLSSEKRQLHPPVRTTKAMTTQSSMEAAPFPLPDSWEWVQLGTLVIDGPRNGYSPKPVDYQTSTRALTLSATTSGLFDDSQYKYIAEVIPADSPYWLVPGDLLFQRGNTIDYVGIAAVYDGPAHAFIYPDLMIRVRCSPDVDVEFIQLAANSDVGRRHFGQRASGTSGSMPKISQSDVMDLPVPLPPLAEQRRIVAKLRQVMALCDALEARITSLRDTAAEVATSVLYHLTAS